LIIKLDIVGGFCAFGKVFKVTNIKTPEIKVLKAIPIIYNSQNENSKKFKIGMEMRIFGSYDKIFVEGDFEIIIMDYFEK
jgi:serine/threonine protein kinase